MRIKIAIASLVGVALIAGLLYWSQRPQAANRSTPPAEIAQLPSPSATAHPALTAGEPTAPLATATPRPALAAEPTVPPPAATAPSEGATSVVAQPNAEVTSSPVAESSSSPVPTLTPQPPPTAQPVEPQAVLPSPTPNPTAGIVGPSPTEAGRLAPDTSAGPLRFGQIRIFADATTGKFAGRANITNTGQTFLNGIVVSWRILDSAGQLIDQGQSSWPSLAPGETATIPLNGSAPFVDTWARVEFAYQG